MSVPPVWPRPLVLAVIPPVGSDWQPVRRSCPPAVVGSPGSQSPPSIPGAISRQALLSASPGRLSWLPHSPGSRFRPPVTAVSTARRPAVPPHVDGPPVTGPAVAVCGPAIACTQVPGMRSVIPHAPAGARPGRVHHLSLHPPLPVGGPPPQGVNVVRCGYPRRLPGGTAVGLGSCGQKTERSRTHPRRARLAARHRQGEL